MKYNTVLFDADDTLLDFKKSERTAVAKVLEEFNLPSGEKIISTYSQINNSLWKLLEIGGITKEELKTERFRKLCKHFNFKASPELMAEKYVYALSEQSYLIDSAEDVCKRLFENGIRLYIITNGIKYIQTKRFSATPLVKYFKNTFISEEIGYEKPNKEFFERATALIENFDPTKTLVIGDSLSSDMKGGISFGLDTCWYNPSHNEKPNDMEITYEIHELNDILPILGT